MMIKKNNGKRMDLGFLLIAAIGIALSPFSQAGTLFGPLLQDLKKCHHALSLESENQISLTEAKANQLRDYLNRYDFTQSHVLYQTEVKVPTGTEVNGNPVYWTEAVTQLTHEDWTIEVKNTDGEKTGTRKGGLVKLAEQFLTETLEILDPESELLDLTTVSALSHHRQLPETCHDLGIATKQASEELMRLQSQNQDRRNHLSGH